MIKIKRPILICAIGFLIGIIYGLYFKKSIAFIIVTFLIVFYLALKVVERTCVCQYRFLHLLKAKNIRRYLKIIISKKIIILFCISAIISNAYLIYLGNKYENFYRNVPDKIKITAVVVSEKTEKEYTYTYVVKVKYGEYKNKKFILNLKKDEKNVLKYGDLINIEGKYLVPSTARNYKGFDYANYLKSKKIYGTIKGNKIEILKSKNLNLILLKSNDIRNFMEKQSKNLLPEKTSSLLIGIILGNKEVLSEEIIENFRKSNLSHILAVSGAHTSYIILRNNIYVK